MVSKQSVLQMRGNDSAFKLLIGEKKKEAEDLEMHDH